MAESQGVDYGRALRAVYRIVDSLAAAAASDYPDPHLLRAEQRCHRAEAAIDGIRTELDRGVEDNHGGDGRQ